MNNSNKTFSKRALLRQFARRNTLKTVFGYLLTLLRGGFPATLQRKNLRGIYNYLPLSETLATSGQPTEKQFARIIDAGYKTIVNLAPANAENALADEAALLESLGARYIHIPVDFNKPTEQDFQRFVASIERHSGEKLWVHCAANMRVSAFLYRYRCEINGEDPFLAARDLDKIWTPFGVWKKFIRAGDQDTIPVHNDRSRRTPN
ncbi:MAG: protein tyrosine phosphatase family protein [Pseudomonadales bacterium]